MSFPNLPKNISPSVNLDTEDVALLILSSIAFEELALAHIMNSEAEKLQAALGTLVDADGNKVFDHPLAQNLADLLTTNRSIERMLRSAIKKEMLLQFKLEDAVDLLPTVTTTEAPLPPDCETCSIFYNRGALPTTVSGAITINNAKATPLRIRFCGPCSNPKFNDILINVNDQSGTQQFSFSGFVTNIESCNAANDNALLAGEGTITGNPSINGNYDFTLTITSGTQATFVFTNQDTSQTLTVTVNTSANGKHIDIDDCTKS